MDIKMPEINKKGLRPVKQTIAILHMTSGKIIQGSIYYTKLESGKMPSIDREDVDFRLSDKFSNDDRFVTVVDAEYKAHENAPGKKFPVIFVNKDHIEFVRPMEK